MIVLSSEEGDVVVYVGLFCCLISCLLCLITSSCVVSYYVVSACSWRLGLQFMRMPYKVFSMQILALLLAIRGLERIYFSICLGFAVVGNTRIVSSWVCCDISHLKHYFTLHAAGYCLSYSAMK